MYMYIENMQCHSAHKSNNGSMKCAHPFTNKINAPMTVHMSCSYSKWSKWWFGWLYGCNTKNGELCPQNWCHMGVSYTPFISPNSQSLRTELHFQFIRLAAATLRCASVCFHTECRISAFWQVRFKKRSKIEQKNIITPMHCLAFPTTLFGAPFHIENRTVANCGFWLEYASKTPLEVVADLPRRMRLFWLRSQIMRLQSVHIKPHYSQNAFDSTLLAWYERGIRWPRTRN